MDQKVAVKLYDFFTQYPQRNFRKHEILIQAEYEPAGIFYLKQGAVRRYAVTPQGEELTINVFRPISFFPMSWAINRTVSPHYFEAMTQVQTHVAPKDAVMAFIKANPDVTLDLLSRIFKGLDGLMEHVEYLMAGNAYTRLIVVLLITAKRFGDGEGQDVVIKLPMTHSDLAMQAGMSRETVTRELKRLKEKGIASVEHNYIVIHDFQKLVAQLYL